MHDFPSFELCEDALDLGVLQYVPDFLRLRG
jgi:hypothetical protein